MMKKQNPDIMQTQPNFYKPQTNSYPFCAPKINKPLEHPV